MISAVGIDAGKSGGFAWKIGDAVGSQKMPATDSEILQLVVELEELACDSDLPPPEIFLEKVGGYIGVPQTGHSMFNFGRGYGFLIGVLTARQLRLTLIRPQEWQKIVRAGTKGDRSPTAWKNHLRDLACRLYPRQKITLAVSDAYLILEAGLLSQSRATISG
mgnify:CR=1 FL=1|jgi:hypothetical protein|tara:strand:- start:755 stop:1243 length:489 start_codon:yes stop_codon:yes gene_type:complete